MPPRFLSLGDSALVVELGDAIERSVLDEVAALDRAVLAAVRAGRLEGVLETVPTYRSLAVVYDPLRTTRATLERRIAPLLARRRTSAARRTRTFRLPVCYGGEHGPDLDAVAEASGLAPADVVLLHQRETYDVYVLGFLPGFAFMGDVAAPLRLPRRADPRTRVPAGSVAIAGQQTAIYPWQSPGGWHLLGRCPVPLFDARRSPPALLAPADRVVFEAVDAARFRELEAAFAAGKIAPEELVTA
jgi:KipI family sensor histidine kinase inhibitor